MVTSLIKLSKGNNFLAKCLTCAETQTNSLSKRNVSKFNSFEARSGRAAVLVIVCTIFYFLDN